MEGLTQSSSGIEDGGSECCCRIPSPGRRSPRRTGWLCEFSRREESCASEANSIAWTAAVPGVPRAARCRSSRPGKLSSFHYVLACSASSSSFITRATSSLRLLQAFYYSPPCFWASLDQPHCLKSNRQDATLRWSHNLQPQHHAALWENSISVLWRVQRLSAATTISRTSTCSVWPEPAATWTTTITFAPRIASSAAIALHTTTYSCPIWRTLISLSSRTGRI